MLGLIRGFKVPKPPVQDFNLTFPTATSSQTCSVHNARGNESFSQTNHHSVIPLGPAMPRPQAQVIPCSFGFSVALCEVLLELELEDSQGVKGTPFLGAVEWNVLSLWTLEQFWLYGPREHHQSRIFISNSPYFLWHFPWLGRRNAVTPARSLQFAGVAELGAKLIFNTRSGASGRLLMRILEIWARKKPSRIFQLNPNLV